MNNINDYSEYKIKRETMTRIADKLRVVVGKTTPLTPAEIAYYIDRIIFTPQSYASSAFNLTFDSRVSGKLPDVQLGEIESQIILDFVSEVSGLLPEYEIGEILSEFLLNFESSAVGALQEE